MLILGLLPPVAVGDFFLEHNYVQQTCGGTYCRGKEVQMALRP